MKNQLHLCIVSAGLSGDFILIYSYPHEDIIATVLNQIIPIADYENLSIFSNEFVFDDKGTIVDLDVKVNAVGKYTILDN